MVKKIYLAEVTVSIKKYLLQERIEKTYLKLVYAASIQDAENKIRKHFSNDDPYGTNQYVQYVSISETII